MKSSCSSQVLQVLFTRNFRNFLVKGAIWYLLGLLTHQFPNQMDQYQIEIQDVMFNHLNEQFGSKKPEQKAIVGMLKGFRYCLGTPKLTKKQVDTLYLITKVSITPIEDVQRYKVLISKETRENIKT